MARCRFRRIFLLLLFGTPPPHDVMSWTAPKRTAPKRTDADSAAASTAAASTAAAAAVTSIDRRGFVSHLTSGGACVACWSGMPPMTSAAATIASTTHSPLANRFEQDNLTLPPPSSFSHELSQKGVDNTYFPPIMEGFWKVEQTLIENKAPLGMAFVGGRNADVSMAETAMAEAAAQIGIPVFMQWRYVATPWGVAEDRLLNTKTRLNAFAGRPVVASVVYADTRASNRQAALSSGGNEMTPLQTTVVYFKGPAAQKNFVVAAHRAEDTANGAVVIQELQRSIFALTNQNTAPPITVDTEYLWKIDTPMQGDILRGRLRIAEYLNAQSDKLYFEARNRAVSVQDYTLTMTRMQG